MTELTAGDTVEIVGGSYKSKGTATVQHVTAAKVKVKRGDAGGGVDGRDCHSEVAGTELASHCYGVDIQ